MTSIPIHATGGWFEPTYTATTWIAPTITTASANVQPVLQPQFASNLSKPDNPLDWLKARVQEYVDEAVLA